MSVSYIPRVLTIAGSDSSGGAGIEADLKTFTVHGCYGMTCITGLTAQNTLGVKQIFPVNDQGFIRNALDAVFDDVGVDVVKTGMLTSRDTVVTVSKALTERLAGPSRPKIVVDPVMMSTSGAQLLPENAIKSYVTDLIPLADLVTPNLPEAILLANSTGKSVPKSADDVKSVDDIRSLAQAIQGMGPKAVLIKGGHLPLNSSIVDHSDNGENATPRYKVVDVLFNGSSYHLYENDYLKTKNTHGTGCTLASAIASNISQGRSLPDAVKRGIDFVHEAIAHSISIGHGNGPVNHVFRSASLPFKKGHFVEYVLSHPLVADLWHQYTHHPFLDQLAKGTLRLDCFKHYIKQDYLYLLQYARAASISGYKASDIDTIARSAEIVLHIKKELDIHNSYCKLFGITQGELDREHEHLTCKAYTRYLLDVGQSQDWLALQMAMAPCLIGYAQIGRRLIASPTTVHEGNPYCKWVQSYASDEFLEAEQLGKELLETHLSDVSPKRLYELIDIFIEATKLEIAFWDMALNI